MQISRVLFRVFFVVLAVVYSLVLLEFIDPSYLKMEFNVGADVLLMTLVASIFIYIYMRKPKL